MFYAIDTKKHIYAFTTDFARNAFVWDCVTTDAYANLLIRFSRQC